MSGDDIDRTDPPGDPDAALAAEYVLSLLDPAEAAACAAREARDPGFAALVRDWRAGFESLDAEFAAVAPPAGLQRRIEARLFGAEPSLATRLWRSVGLWRAVAAAALLAAVLLAVPRPAPEAPAPALIAALQPLDSGVEFVAYVDPAAPALNLARVSGAPAAGRDFELWLIPQEGAAPLSLGVLPADYPARVALEPATAALIGPQAALAISEEPAGGSPGDAPTGPVVAIGGLDAI
jgi:anti-sigma-K factor RskA